MEVETELLVVGAGPAGSMAAKTASSLGVNVLLIDKKAEIGTPKRCAEGITTDTLTELDIVKDERWISKEISGITLVAPNNKSITLDNKTHNLPYTGYVLERKVFDKHMAALAIKNGTRVLLRCRAYEVEKENDYLLVKASYMDKEITIKSKLIIAADGPQSTIARLMGLDTNISMKDMASCIQYEMVGISKENMNHINIYVGSVAPGGYLWIFPKGKDYANVGLGILKSHTQENARYFLDEFIKTHDECINAQKVEENVGGDPVCGIIEDRYSDNIMVVGDAAGFVNPLTGDGIHGALLSGKYAGMVAYESIKSKDYSKNYLKKYHDLTEEKINHNYKKYNRVKEFLLTLDDNQLNDIVDGLSKTNLNEITIKSLLKIIIKASPRALLKLGKLF